MFVCQSESQGWEWIFLFFRRWSDFAEGSVCTGKLDPSCLVLKKNLENREKAAALQAQTQSHTFGCNDCVWVYLSEPDECIVGNWIAHQREEMCTTTHTHTSTWRDPINTGTDKKKSLMLTFIRLKSAQRFSNLLKCSDSSTRTHTHTHTKRDVYTHVSI